MLFVILQLSRPVMQAHQKEIACCTGYWTLTVIYAKKYPIFHLLTAQLISDCMCTHITKSRLVSWRRHKSLCNLLFWLFVVRKQNTKVLFPEHTFTQYNTISLYNCGEIFRTLCKWIFILLWMFFFSPSIWKEKSFGFIRLTFTVSGVFLVALFGLCWTIFPTLVFH